MATDYPRKRTFQSWADMKQRCFNPKCHNYPNYGGRGITVCRAWKDSFDAFMRDMGERPVGLTLERVNTNGNYEPSNCRWATRAEQRRNQRDCHYLTSGGRTMTIQEWSREIGLHHSAIRRRVKKGWTTEQALNPRSLRGRGVAARLHQGEPK